MSLWKNRPIEEQRLLNPSFCSLLLWKAGIGHVGDSTQPQGISFEECFLVIPMVLHKETRDSLPRLSSSSLAVWMGQNPLAPSTIADRAKSLVPFTKEALRFGGAYGMLRFQGTLVQPNPDWKRRISTVLSDSSDEVQACAKRAEFVGKWFAKTGNAETVMSLLGVRP